MRNLLGVAFFVLSRSGGGSWELICFGGLSFSMTKPISLSKWATRFNKHSLSSCMHPNSTVSSEEIRPDIEGATSLGVSCSSSTITRSMRNLLGVAFFVLSRSGGGSWELICFGGLSFSMTLAANAMVMIGLLFVVALSNLMPAKTSSAKERPVWNASLTDASPTIPTTPLMCTTSPKSTMLPMVAVTAADRADPAAPSETAFNTAPKRPTVASTLL